MSLLSKHDGPIEEWVAVAGGGFKRAAHDMPAFLQANDLLPLYDILACQSLYKLYERCEADRVDFLRYLKDELCIASLSDRQLLANALSRAARDGIFDASGAAAPPTAVGS